MDVDADTPEARSRLQKFVTEQTRALATAHLRLQLTDRLTSLGTLAAGLGHDLNNVLLPIQARLNAAEHAGVSKEAMEHLQEIRRALLFLQHLSDGLHVLSIDPKGEGSDAENAQPTHLATWWRQVGGLLRTAVPRHVRLNVSVPVGLPSVALAPHWLTQAVLNILVNAGEAIPATAKKPGLISISAAPEMDGKTLRLSIRDNGHGMTAAVQRRALDPFFTTKPRSLGTGLGLPISRNVISRVGGAIEIKSAPGKGTAIVLVLPVARVGGTARNRQSGPGLHAVVALTERDTLMLLNQMLAAAGFLVAQGSVRAPDGADLWVTAPSAKTLQQAERWHRRRPGRRIILIGAPDRESLSAWVSLGAAVIESKNDFKALRTSVADAVTSLRRARSRTKGVKP